MASRKTIHTLARFDSMDSTCKRIIACAFRVGKKLGVGPVEKAYELALVKELEDMGIKPQKQKKIQIYVDGVVVGMYIIDILVGHIIVELKTVECLRDLHYNQCLRYIGATKFNICLLINFGTRDIQIELLER